MTAVSASPRTHRSVSHSPSLHPASSVATERQPGIRHPEPGEFRQHGDQCFHWQLRLHPRKVRDWLCFHGNTQVCPFSQERGQGTHLAAVHEETFVSFCFQRLVSRHVRLLFSTYALSLLCHHTLLSSVRCSACGLEAQRIEEMEKMLKEAQQEKARLIENRVSSHWNWTSIITSYPITSSEVSIRANDKPINHLVD